MANKKVHIEKRITLDEIGKKPIFEVSDGYFDKLPTRIQDRVIELDKKRTPSYVLALKFALPVVALILISTYLGLRFDTADLDVQAMIDDVSTEELITYLNDSELSTEELISLIDIGELDIDGMVNDNVEFLNESELEEFLDDYPDFESDL